MVSFTILSVYYHVVAMYQKEDKVSKQLQMLECHVGEHGKYRVWHQSKTFTNDKVDMVFKELHNENK